MRKAEGGDKKAPADALAKVKYEVLPTAAFVLPAPRRWPLPARRYPTRPAARCAAVPGTGVFRPPVLSACLLACFFPRRLNNGPAWPCRAHGGAACSPSRGAFYISS